MFRIFLIITAFCFSTAAVAQEVEIVPARGDDVEFVLYANGQKYVRSVFGLDGEIERGWSRVAGGVHYSATPQELRLLNLDSPEVQSKFRELQMRAETANENRNFWGFSVDEYRLFLAIYEDTKWSDQSKGRIPPRYVRFVQDGGTWIEGGKFEWTGDWSYVSEPPSVLNEAGKRLFVSMMKKAKRYHDAQQAEWGRSRENRRKLGEGLFSE